MPDEYWYWKIQKQIGRLMQETGLSRADVDALSIQDFDDFWNIEDALAKVRRYGK